MGYKTISKKLGEKETTDYSEMEEIQNNHQSPSVWSSMQDLTSWGKDDHEKDEGSSQQLRKELINDLKQTSGNTLRREGLKSCSAGAHAQESTCTGPAN